jgi:hypothetical protein
MDKLLSEENDWFIIFLIFKFCFPIFFVTIFPKLKDSNYTWIKFIVNRASSKILNPLFCL